MVGVDPARRGVRHADEQSPFDRRKRDSPVRGPPRDIFRGVRHGYRAQLEPGTGIVGSRYPTYCESLRVTSRSGLKFGCPGDPLGQRYLLIRDLETPGCSYAISLGAQIAGIAFVT